MGPIELAVRVDLLVFSFILDITILGYILAQHQIKEYSIKLYIMLISSIGFVTLAEIVSWLVSEPGNTALIPLRYWSNAIYFAFIAFPACFGMMYLDFKIFGDQRKTKKHSVYYLIPAYLGIGVIIYNFLVPGVMFGVDATNHYYRGPLVYLSTAVAYGFMFLVLIIFFKHKKLMTSRMVKAVGFYYLIPMIGLVLQLLGYGTTLTMPSQTLGAFFLFLLLEREELFRDSLTYLYTRHNFEKALLKKSMASDPFSILLIDMNDFKAINDSYGHLKGDELLKVVADSLIDNTRVEDVVCRYGGDEFILLLEHTQDIGDELIERIEKSIMKHNAHHKIPISLSYGHLYVEGANDKTPEELIRIVDKRMYKDKKRRKNIIP